MSKSITSDAVRARLRLRLREADLNVVTERDLIKEVASHFGVPVDEHADLVHEEVERFLLGGCQGDLDGAGGLGVDDETGTKSGSKRARKDGGDDTTSGRKIAKGAAAADTGVQLQVSPSASADVTFDVALTGDSKTRARVRATKNGNFVDMRQFWEKDGALLPTKKGIMLSAGDWHLVAAALGDAQSALQARDTTFLVQLSGTRRMLTSDYKGRVTVNIREYYEDDGELKPGRNGISLGADALECLVRAAAEMSSAVGPGAPEAAAASTSAAAAPSRATASASSAAASVAGGPQALTSGTGDTIFELGSGKFASVSEFKGKRMVGLREHYQKDGAWMPGKKGISLLSEQFETLCSNVAAASKALDSHDESFKVDLSSMRQLYVSKYAGKWLVNVREFYEKDGQMLPGSKGISLNPDQWAALTRLLVTLRKHMAA